MKVFAPAACAAAAAALSLASPASAAVYCAPTQINAIEQGFNGYVILHMSYGVFSICSLDGNVGSPIGTVTPATCQGWLSGLLTSFAQRKSIEIFFPDGTGSSCATAQYSTRAPQTILFRP